MGVTRAAPPSPAIGKRPAGAAQYDGPTIGRRAKSLPPYRRVWPSSMARRSDKGRGAAALGRSATAPALADLTATRRFRPFAAPPTERVKSTHLSQSLPRDQVRLCDPGSAVQTHNSG